MMYKEIADQITDFLFSRQVILKEVKISLDNNGMGEFEGKILRGDKSKSKFRFQVKDDGLYVVQDKTIGPLKKFFRLKFGNFDYEVKVNENKAIENMDGYAKLNFLSRRAYFHSKTSISHALKGDFSLLSDFAKRIKKRFVKEIQLKNQGGITFRIKTISKEFIELECYDYGGIFDDNVNNEGDNFPPQVMGEYYADAYSSYCFARKYLETKNEDYLKASLMCLDFVKKTYDYYPSGIFGISRDFKNPAYMETILLLGGQAEQYKSLIPVMKEDLYEPTNVFALRYYWHSLRKRFTEDDYLEIPIKRLKRDQTEGGLIKDDNDNDYKDAYDLTYHNYSLASLARGLVFNPNDEIKDIFIKGVRFSLDSLTKDGEISYNGRASNNIYHVASCIYAFEYACDLLDNKDELRSACDLMFSHLKKFILKNGSFPTAMNKFSKERVAWSHCSTPYNALVAYLLYLSDDLHKSYKNEPVKNKFFVKSRYGFFSNDDYYLTLFSGCNRSYGWSGEMHRTGIPGISVLGVKESLIPCLDETQGIIVSDMPNLFFNDRKISFYGKARLEKENNSFVYIKENEDFIFRREYILEIKKVKVKTKIKFLSDGKLQGNLIQVPVLSYSYEIDKQSIKYKNLRYVLDTRNLVETKEITNPRGKVKVLSLMKIDKRIKRDQELDYEYEILIEDD